MTSGLSSSAETVAFGLPVRNGSTRTVVPSWVSSKAAWPRNRISMSFLLGDRMAGELPSQLDADRDADEHPQAGLLGDQCADGPLPLHRVLRRGRLADLGGVGLAEPAAGGEGL